MKSYSRIDSTNLLQNRDFDSSAPKILHNERHIKKREIAKIFFIKKN